MFYRDGVLRHGAMSRQQSNVTQSHVARKLPAISPDRLSIDRNTPSPFLRNTRQRRSLDESRLPSARSQNDSGLGMYHVMYGVSYLAWCVA